MLMVRFTPQRVPLCYLKVKIVKISIVHIDFGLNVFDIAVGENK